MSDHEAMRIEMLRLAHTLSKCERQRDEAVRALAEQAARIEALCEQAVAGYEPHDVTPWVAVHELRAALEAT